MKDSTAILFGVFIALLIIASILFFSDVEKYSAIVQNFTDNFSGNSSAINKDENKQSIYSEKQKTKEELVKEKIIIAMDYMNKTTMNFARQLAKQSPGEFNIDQICNIYSYCYDNWSYVNDPKNEEYFQKASETIKTLGNDNKFAGDCDDYAILVATLIKCIGGTSRVVLAHNNASGHAYPEVLVANSNSEMEEILDGINNHYSDYFDNIFGVNKVEELHYHVDNSGKCWLNLDYYSKYPGGEIYDGEIKMIVE